MHGIKRVLIVKVSAMGDIIHALPVSAALKEAYPHLDIIWAVEEAFVPLLEGNPCISSLVVLPKISSKDLRKLPFYTSYFAIIRKACAEGVDLSLDLQGLTKSAVIALKSGAKTRLAYHWLREGARLLEKAIPKRRDSVHIVDQYLDVARALGAPPAVVKFPFYISQADEDLVTARLSEVGIEPGVGYISINPASAKAIKEWGAGNYAALCDWVYDSTGVPAVVVTADITVSSNVVALAKRPIANLAGKTTLKQLAAVIKRSAAHVCGDTGSGHLAAALERPVVALIGPTDPERACPYGQRANTISHREACGTKCNGRHCEFDKPKCMAAISVSEVSGKVGALLNVR